MATAVSKNTLHLLQKPQTNFRIIGINIDIKTCLNLISEKAVYNRGVQMANTQMKMFTASLITGKCNLKVQWEITTQPQHFKMKNTGGTKCTDEVME